MVPHRRRASAPPRKRSGVTRACSPCSRCDRACVTVKRSREISTWRRASQWATISLHSRRTLLQKLKGWLVGPVYTHGGALLKSVCARRAAAGRITLMGKGFSVPSHARTNGGKVKLSSSLGQSAIDTIHLRENYKLPILKRGRLTVAFRSREGEPGRFMAGWVPFSGRLSLSHSALPNR